MTTFYHTKSVSEAHQFLRMKPPAHPLITIIREWPRVENFDFTNTRITSDLYIIGCKGGTGAMRYGRNVYDYEEGTIVCIAPKQALSFDGVEEHASHAGWTIFFHPDLIRKSELGKTIKEYAFFDYAVHEALHLSEKEKHILSDLVGHIEIEIHQNIDRHSQELIVSTLQSILKYCQRFYDRQFFTRTNLNKDYIMRFEQYLEEYFASETLMDNGLPTVSQCGEALNMSASYLSDVLRAETGRSAKDHIHNFIIEKAKTLLLSSHASVGEIAYSLGFEYPQHFTKLFKAKTGFSPSEYKMSN
jgi:AraC-like DNA-binding protein